jgi:transposase
MNGGIIAVRLLVRQGIDFRGPAAAPDTTCRRFHRRKYGQRWQVESTFNRHKRLLGAALRARSDAARECERFLRVLTHNLMLLAAMT